MKIQYFISRSHCSFIKTKRHYNHHHHHHHHYHHHIKARWVRLSYGVLGSLQVFAVVVASSSYDSVTTASVSYTCGFYHIPVICTHSRDYIFSDKVSESEWSSLLPYSEIQMRRTSTGFYLKFTSF